MPRFKARVELQWGRGHLTAEMLAREVGKKQREMLQWGRGHLTAEMPAAPHRRHVDRTASMGPRSFDRGNVFASVGIMGEPLLQWGRGHLTAEIDLVLTAGSQHLYASMGPRSFDRGNNIRHLVPVQRNGFNGAAVI